MHTRNRSHHRPAGQRGQTLVIFALSATFLVGLAGLAIEGGLVEADRRFDQAISDGAALAGANKLPIDAVAARDSAVDYAIAGLNSGVIPTGCSEVTLYAASNDQRVQLPSGCDPSPPHFLTIDTGYNSNASDVLVRLDRTIPLNLAAAVGFGTATTASRSVARGYTGGGPFAFALYAKHDLQSNGNADTQVAGDVYVQGCIRFNNSNTLTVTPYGSQAGDVQVYDKDIAGPQVWDSGAGVGCTAKVLGQAVGGSQWGAAGHTVSTESCAPLTNFSSTCPASQQPVPLIEPPSFKVTDTTGIAGGKCTDPGSVQQTFSTTAAGVAVSGCYSACSGGGGNAHIPDGTTFTAGTYAFVGNGTAGGCDVIVDGSAASLSGGVGGVTFILYNGTSMCASTCGNSNSSGTINLSAPTSGPNYGVLVYTCGTPCPGGTTGEFHIEGPHWNVTLNGLIYDPGGQCVIKSNSGQVVNGQVICNDVDVQGGTVSLGSGVIFGGTNLPTPNSLAQLLQ